MIEHAAERVLGVFGLDRVLDGFADGDAQAAGAVRVFLQHFAAKLSLVTWAGKNLGAPGLHHELAIRFLVEAHLDHVNGAFETNKRQASARTNPTGRRRFPWPGVWCRPACCSKPGPPPCWACDCRGADALVLVIDVGGRLQGLFQPHRAEQRRGSPQGVDVAHLLRISTFRSGFISCMTRFSGKIAVIMSGVTAVLCPDAAAAAAVPENPREGYTSGRDVVLPKRETDALTHFVYGFV